MTLIHAALMPGAMTDKQLAVLGVIVIAIFFFLRRQLARGTRSAVAAKTPERPRAAAELQEIKDGLEVRLHDSFREMSGRLDMKMNALVKLIDDADSRIAELRRLSETKTISEPLAREAELNVAAEPAPVEEEPLVIEMERRAGRLGKHRSRETPPQIEEVYKLADQGLSPREISSQLGRSLDEVDLILAVRPTPEPSN